MQIVVDFGGGPEWCGATSTNGTGGGRITLTTRNPSQGHCNTNWSTDLGKVLVHEFGHLLGYTGGSHKFGAEAATGCAHYLPDDHTINGTVCQHEVEYLYAEYGYRAAPTDPNFWSIPIITGIDALPNPLTVPYAGSAQILYGNFLFANQPTFQSSQPMNGAPVQWTSLDSRATVDANGRVINHNSVAQPADVFVKAMTGSIPSGDQLGLKMETIGTLVSVHLNGTPGPTPPGAGFRISAITTSATPFTSATPQQLTAVVENGGYPVSVLWWATYSDNSTYDFSQQASTSATLSLPVHPGSYNIQVRARPMNGKQSGTEFVQDFPVCTTSGGGGGDLAAPRNDGPTPDVITGCTPP